MALELTHRPKASTMASELLIIQLNETHGVHLCLEPETQSGTHFWTDFFYVVLSLIIAFVLLTLAMLVCIARHERVEEQRLRTREERYRACNRFCPDCDAAMYEEEERATGQYYSQGNPAVSEWPETDLLNPD